MRWLVFLGMGLALPACGGSERAKAAEVPSPSGAAALRPLSSSTVLPVASLPSNALPKPIVQVGAPVLRARARDVTPQEIPTPEFQALVDRMIGAMRTAPGVGLAAPQLGVSLRVFVLEDREDLVQKLTPLERDERERAAFLVRVFVNPVVRPLGGERATFFEGCLSVSGYAALVERAREVEVTGLDREGKPSTWRARGWPARILQHEVDHLEGTLYVDRMLTRSFSTSEQAKALYAGKPIAEIREKLGLQR